MRRDWIYPVKRLILSDQASRWCRLPYPDHPKGCPNYGKAEKCPPEAPAAGDYFDLSRPTWLVHSEFNLSSHIARMEKKHPEWTLKQCRCVLYWQPTSRRQLKYRIKEALSIVNADGSTLIPEAMGVKRLCHGQVIRLAFGKDKAFGNVPPCGFDRIDKRQSPDANTVLSSGKSCSLFYR